MMRYKIYVLYLLTYCFHVKSLLKFKSFKANCWLIIVDLFGAINELNTAKTTITDFRSMTVLAIFCLPDSTCRSEIFCFAVANVGQKQIEAIDIVFGQEAAGGSWLD